MSASFHRPSPPVRQMFVDSLMVTPPSKERLGELLSKASSDAGWAAWAMTDDLLDEAEASLGAAYLALQSFRGVK